MTFAVLQTRLNASIRARIRNGELTERGLARMTGISQPHIHNVLKGVRILSTEFADQILRELNLSVLDLIQAEEFLAHYRDRRLDSMTSE